MNKLYQNISIKNIAINKEYSISGKVINLLNTSEGIDIDINAMSKIRTLSNLEKIKPVYEYYRDLAGPLNISGSINFKPILGNNKSKEYLNYLKEEILKTSKMLTTYHTEIFPHRKRCYSNLASLLYDGKEVEKPIYDHSGITGRTSIKSGFNFLTLKKEKRKLLKSTSGKNLFEVDFKSCEPFFYLLSQGFDIDNRDVYKWISDKYGIDFKNRDRTKRGILSMIYGANEYTISKLMKISESKVVKIKDDLGINALKERLESEFEENGVIFNYYGRPITSNNNVVNYWIQSSTVDFCSLAFRQFYDENGLQPAYFIHDSMTFEIPDNKIKDITGIDNIKEKLSNISIPVEFKKVS